MSAVRKLLLGSLAVVCASCLDGTSPQTTDAQIRIINASAVTVNIAVDGTPELDFVQPSNVSAFFTSPGPHKIIFSGDALLSTLINVTATSQGVTTAYLYTSANGQTGVAALDTGSTTPVGKSKVRVSLLSRAIGPVDVWRTQPDFQTPIHIQTPFPYLTTSPFVQSDSGVWRVFVTPVGSSTPLLSTTFDVPSTGRRTVVLLDSAGIPVFRVLPE